MAQQCPPSREKSFEWEEGRDGGFQEGFGLLAEGVAFCADGSTLLSWLGGNSHSIDRTPLSVHL